MTISTSPTKGPSEGKAVVIIDDNAALRKTVGHAFLEDGFRFYGEAADGAQGIVVVKQLKPDLAIINLSMPIMNGLQAALILRRLFPRTKTFPFSSVKLTNSFTSADSCFFRLTHTVGSVLPVILRESKMALPK